MPDQFTHLLWGYMLSRNISEDRRFILLGMFMAMVPDLDAFMPFFTGHHGFMHTPLFLVSLTLVIFFSARMLKYAEESRTIAVVCLVNVIVHLLLDTVGTAADVMWYYPVDNIGFALGDIVSLAVLIIIKIILVMIPISYILYRYRKYRENPLDLERFLEEKLGKRTTYALIVIFTIMTLYSVVWYD